MNIVKMGTAALLALCVVHAGERSAQVYEHAVGAKVKPSDSGAAAAVNSEVFQNVVLAAGKGVALDSTLDYSSATTVAVSVQCNSCTSAATSLASAGLTLQARWLVPNAEFYASTESKPATSFPYWDAGGVLFNVYGSQFELILQNTGTQTVSIAQITIFRRGQ